MLSNKVKKRYKHLKKRFARQGIEVFRLYDWDIPEIRAVVDWYAGHLVIGEYVRKHSIPGWLEMMGEAAAGALGVPMENVHLKARHAGWQDGKRYERIDNTNRKIVVSERDLKFYVNPCDYVDTGLFSDHRDTRQMVRDMAQDRDFLNLFCYTGTFSCYAAKGGARSTVSVDRSKSAIDWVQENMVLNDIPVIHQESMVLNDIPVIHQESMVLNDIPVIHQENVEGFEERINENNGVVSDGNNRSQRNILVQAHTFDYLEKAKQKGLKFDLAVVDPPSYSTSRNMRHRFDISSDHPALLKGVAGIMKKGGHLFFSTNHQNFELDMDKLAPLELRDIKEITSITIPEDYKTPAKQIHRCWKITI
ncbi:putative SAM-dependent methyltransferase family protein [Desulfamplus magnetovallimortis]|uniref:Putative SAM-dependent methyltransferase family protein n=2 Tax=Desulfamplus magnetovallimortis TaxID=1246637 RepID=A0A1W1H812_9BACT|nr:putative SAM-dependent methyltransferase family protein [Desulfamplus magnetovallimortis]